jgi:hypothetical protein
VKVGDLVSEKRTPTKAAVGVILRETSMPFVFWVQCFDLDGKTTALLRLPGAHMKGERSAEWRRAKAIWVARGRPSSCAILPWENRARTSEVEGA